MESWFQASLTAYKAQAAATFFQLKQAKACAAKSASNVNPADANGQTFERVMFPALDQYLSKAAKAYEHWKHHKHVMLNKRLSPQKLGTGEPVQALFASHRRERWLASLAKRAHFIRAPVVMPFVPVVICTIPEDIRKSAHQRYIAHKSNLVQRSIEEADNPLYPMLGILQPDEVSTEILALIISDKAYTVHTTRCRTLFLEGKRNLVQINKTTLETHRDDCEEVSRRYVGKPDELYRRKTARKFAKWRRQQREQEKEKMAAEIRAEKEMKRRRGYDHRLTERKARDSTFAPFLFDTSCNAYAYSSKITEAPKLRKVMITKYTDADESSNEQEDQWERAREAAKTNPLFHTRVMNRFA
ncbi:unnamed protein product [Agarophyton chilense]|eukprot:gb/GEZJ01001845.1/.p2 GENE.gb/GEZJ01001845.1/~~gb/GEZJ01001845.1/.p2  ORF type:complete len:358 (-),score=52.71 gb/GEZJ01001845.1/:3100-4173(-)